MQLNKIKQIIQQSVYKNMCAPTVTPEVQNVFDLFKDYYGRARIDMQYQCAPDTVINEILNMAGMTASEYYPAPDGLKEVFHGTDTIAWASQRLSDIGVENFAKWIDEVIASYLQRVFTSGVNIIVWFPKAKITNEHDKSVEIYDLYARVGVGNHGIILGRPKYKRTTYPMYQLKQGYMHSHTPRMYPDEMNTELSNWRGVCTGLGPINNTIHTLRENFNEMAWTTFCWELDKIVHIESEAGTPYFYMRNLVQTSGDNERMQIISTSTCLLGNYMDSFIRYFLGKKCLKFSYYNGCYHLGESIDKFLLDLSNSFIEWYNLAMLNKELSSREASMLRHIMKEYIVKDNKLYNEETLQQDSDFTRYIGKEILPFKGEMKTLKINDYVLGEDSITKVTLFSFNEASQLLYSILRVINYKYGKKTNRECQSEGSSTLQGGRQIYFR